MPPACSSRVPQSIIKLNAFLCRTTSSIQWMVIFDETLGIAGNVPERRLRVDADTEFLGSIAKAASGGAISWPIDSLWG